MAVPQALHKARRSTIGKVTSFLCFGEPRVHPAANPQKTIADGGKQRPEARGPRAVGSDHLAQVDVLVQARPSIVEGIPVNLVEATHSLQGGLRKQKSHAADLTGKLQRLTDELQDERAHSAKVKEAADSQDRAAVATLTSDIISRVVQGAAAADKAALEAEAEDRLLVSRMVAKAHLRAVTAVLAEETASEAAKQREHEVAPLKEESRMREEELTAKVIRLSEQVVEADEVAKLGKEKIRDLMARVMEKTQELHTAKKEAGEMEAQLEDMEDLIARVVKLSEQVDEANEMERLRRDKLRDLMAGNLEKTQKLQAADKRAEDLGAQLEDMKSEVESLQEALVQLPVLPEEDCRFIKDLGEGSYGKVTLRCIAVAVKELKKPEDALALLKEEYRMARLRHQAIPGAMAWMQKKDGTLGLAMQYVDGQSMEQFREKRSAGDSLDLDPTGPAGLSVLEHLTEPIEHIHTQGHVHRDISCRNVMICEDYDGHFRPHLIDFGLAYDMRSPPRSWGGSPGYMRPVVVLYPGEMGLADDVRGYCAVAWEFLSGRDIWETLHDDYKAAIEANWSIEDDVHDCLEAKGYNSGDFALCLAAAEYLGHIGIGEEYFEPLLKNPRMPAKALRLIARGLSHAVARGEEAPPSLADIRAALEADRNNAEVAEVMSLLGYGI